jgi:hypothetical protein
MKQIFCRQDDALYLLLMLLLLPPLAHLMSAWDPDLPRFSGGGCCRNELLPCTQQL